MTPIKLYNSSRTGAIRYWQVSRDKDILTFEHGQENTTNPIITTWKGSYKNKGKANEVTPEQDAQNEMERSILGKERKGYSSTHPSLVKSVNVMSCPEKLRFYKPQAKVTKQMKDVILNGNPIVTRKYDGEMMVIRVDDGDVTIYSRSMLPSHHLEVGEYTWNDRFPEIVDCFENLKGQHIFTGEMVADPYGADDRWLVAKVLKSKTDKAIQVQRENTWLKYVIWDWPVRNGAKHTETYSFRMDQINSLVEDLQFMQGTKGVNNVERPEIMYDFKSHNKKRPKDADSFITSFQKEAEVLKYEGFIIADGDATFESELYNFRGKTDRPKTMCKIKPIYEDDFVAFWNPEDGDGTYGKGKQEGLLGSVALYQLDSDGDSTYICDCGGGFNDEFRKEARKEDFPMVLEVMYESRTYVSNGDKTNALQFPRMVRVRHDKDIEECINEQL